MLYCYKDKIMVALMYIKFLIINSGFMNKIIALNTVECKSNNRNYKQNAKKYTRQQCRSFFTLFFISFIAMQFAYSIATAFAEPGKEAISNVQASASSAEVKANTAFDESKAQSPFIQGVTAQDNAVAEATYNQETSIEYQKSTLSRHDIIAYLRNKRANKETPNVSRDLGTNLAGLDLTGLDFSGVNLLQADFRNANISTANFKDAELEGADFTGAIMERTNFVYSNIANCKFVNAKAKGALFNSAFAEGSIMDNSNFTSAKFRNANFSNVSIVNNTILDNVDMESVELINATIDKLHLKDTVLRFAHLSNAKITNTIFDGNNLYGTLMNSTTIQDSSFKGATMYATNLASAQIANTIFDNAYAEAINFSWSSVKNSTFIGAYMGNALFYGSEFDDVKMTKVNAEYSDLQKIKWTNVNVSEANLIHASLKNSVLKRFMANNSIMSGCNLSLVLLVSSVIINSDLHECVMNNISIDKSVVTKNNMKNVKGIEKNKATAAFMHEMKNEF